MGVEEFGVAVGGEGDGTGELNILIYCKMYLYRNLFTGKTPHLMLELSITSRCKNISIIFVIDAVYI